MTAELQIETPKSQMTFELAEALLSRLQGIVGQHQQELAAMHDRAEQLQRDILAADQKADDELSRYRACLHDGEKVQSNQALERVSEERKKAKDFRSQLAAILPEIPRLRETIGVSQKEILDFAATKFLLDIQWRLKLALGHEGQVINALSHIDGRIDGLAAFVQKNIEGTRP